MSKIPDSLSDRRTPRTAPGSPFDEDGRDPSGNAPGEANASARNARGRVLVIDDSDAARATIQSLLRKAGFETFELPSAIGATRAIVRDEIKVVVLDITMPGLSGDRLIEVLRSNARLSRLIIIVVSGKDAQELERLRKNSSADDVISKHDVREMLVASINRQLCRVSSARLAPMSPSPSETKGKPRP